MRRIALIRVSTLYHFSAKLRNYFKLKPNFGVEFLDAILSRTLCVSILYVRIVAHESVWLRMVVKWGFIGQQYFGNNPPTTIFYLCVVNHKTQRMDRRNALKWMGISLAAAAMAGVAPLTYSAIVKDRERGKKRLVL